MKNTEEISLIEKWLLELLSHQTNQSAKRFILVCSKFIELYPDLELAYYKRAQALLGIGETEQAIINLKKAIMLDSQYAEAYHLLGVSYNTQGQVDKAIASYKKALQISPQYSNVYDDLSVAYKNIAVDISE